MQNKSISKCFKSFIDWIFKIKKCIEHSPFLLLLVPWELFENLLLNFLLMGENKRKTRERGREKKRHCYRPHSQWQIELNLLFNPALSPNGNQSRSCVCVFTARVGCSLCIVDCCDLYSVGFLQVEQIVLKRVHFPHAVSYSPYSPCQIQSCIDAVVRLT